MPAPPSPDGNTVMITTSTPTPQRHGPHTNTHDASQATSCCNTNGQPRRISQSLEDPTTTRHTLDSPRKAHQTRYSTPQRGFACTSTEQNAWEAMGAHQQEWEERGTRERAVRPSTTPGQLGTEWRWVAGVGGRVRRQRATTPLCSHRTGRGKLPPPHAPSPPA